MADSVTSIPKTFVVVSPDQPASPFEGQLWRDTSNDVLKQWDGSSWVSVQASADQESIGLTPSGEFQVLKPRTDVLANLTSSVGDWNISSDYGWERDTSDSYYGGACISGNAKSDSSGYAEISRDVTNADKIIVAYKDDPNYDEGGFLIKINGSTVITFSGQARGSWITKEADISNFTGQATIRAETDPSPPTSEGNNNKHYLDYFALKTSGTYEVSGNGA